jgi:hypothetical protein
MLAMVFWALFKMFSTSVNIFTMSKKAWDASFQNKMEHLMDAGEYKKSLKAARRN